jgi:hypothetical protein
MAVGADAEGNVYVITDPPPTDPPTAATPELVKFNAGGRKEWSLDLDLGWWPSAWMSVMPDGDAVLGVCSARWCYTDDGTTVTLAVQKITASGTVAWTTPLRGTGFSTLQSDRLGRTLAVTSSGETWHEDYRVLLLSDAGDVLLDQPTSITAADLYDMNFERGGVRGALGGSSGDFILAGKDPVTSRPLFERRRSDGTLVFRKLVDATDGVIDRVAFASNGSIALAGSATPPLTWGSVTHEHYGFLLVASGDGSPQWSQADYELIGYPRYVAFGVDNDVLVHTQTTAKGDANLRSYTRDGVLQWRHDFDRGAWVHPISVAATGDVVVVAHGTGDAPFEALPYPAEVSYVAVLAP